MEFIRSPILWSKFLKNNGYTLHQCIGNGSFGDVFEVTKIASSVRFAVKRIVVRGNISEDSYVRTEINALMTFHHANIIGLVEFFLHPSLACLVLELASGGNLEFFILEHKRAVNEAFIQITFRQLLSAVGYCHQHGYAHRDINPSNILLFSDNLVKLADFGLCVQCTDDKTGEPVLCGNYLGHEAFLAPEVKLHKPFDAKHADIWSLGCVLFFMINRHNPSANETDPSNMVDITEKNMRLLKSESKFSSLCLIVIRRSCSTKGTERLDASQLISLWVH